MKKIRTIPGISLLFIAPAAAGFLRAAEDAAAQAAADTNTAAAAAVATGRATAHTPDFLEHLVDAVLGAFHIGASGNTTTHYVIAALFLAGAFLLRRLVTTGLFGILKRFARKTETTLDDKLFSALETPVASLVVVVGGVCAMKVLKLSPSADHALGYAYTIAFSFVIFWILLRTFNTVLDHLHGVALEKGMGIGAFMPWIKKTLLVVFVIFGVLMIAQNLGADVKAFLAGLGIGGLAFALAAQDTIANVFGSVVVAVDQPFKIGETVKIGANTGTVEDIGLRSTKIRLVDKSLATIPNKAVASETIVNLARFTARRVEQVIGLTYATKAGQMQELVEEFRRLMLAEPEIDPASVTCFFRDFSASSLDVWIAYVVKDPDFNRHMALRQRLNLAFMNAIEARGLSFAYPTQTVMLEGPLVKKIAERAT